ncbi:hypothetical protein [Bacillus sp. es.036]|uniref:hypothetical protein n=1 Tax=Bacillus sp. es.036 TaxID=1761764 RepID=UPI000BF60812|nr:hypothetical protein [Bacillus sp. es.036]PFG12061.1 hypothetical protein ATG70_0231 [Bacillus sp. es.036]
MYASLWVIIGFCTIGLIVLMSMKKTMENRLATIKVNGESKESARASRSIIWWVVSTVAWGILSISLFIWWLNQYFEMSG